MARILKKLVSFLSEPLVEEPKEAQAAQTEPGSALKTEDASSTEAPKVLKEAQQKRKLEAEEWRPGDGTEKKEGSGSSQRRRRRRRGPRKPREGDEQASEAGEGSEKRSGEAQAAEGERPPRQRQRRSRSEGSRKEGSREGGRDRNRGPRNSRGKGFSFPRPKPEPSEWDPASYVVEPEEGKQRFSDLDLPVELLRAVADLGYKYGTPIQSGILPEILGGRDGLGQAQTGTGKTAAFLLSSLSRMLRNPIEDLPNGSPRLLILAPTRELVLQIEAEAAVLAKHTPFQSLPVYGGLDYEAQKEALLHNRVDIVAATPGRLIDFLRSRVIKLDQVQTLVLDEADRMLDMGFIPDVKRIVYATPHKDKRQTLFFSATFSDDVRRLAQSWTKDPASVIIEPESVAADTVDQNVYIVTGEEKFPLTVNLLRKLNPARCLIFLNRRDRSQDLCDKLKAYEFKVELLTGAVPQAKRVRTLEAFKDGRCPILVATDVAGRGIHVDDVELVINFDLPEDPEDYVHRIGRTGRAGSEGQSVCFASEMDAMMLPDIEKYIGRELNCIQPESDWLDIEKREIPRRKPRQNGGGGGGRGGPRGGGRGGPRGGSRGGSRGGGGRSRR